MAAKPSKSMLVAKAAGMAGKEPDATKIVAGTEEYTSQMIGCLNWYSYEKERKDAYRYLREWVKNNRKNDLATFDKNVGERDIIITAGWVARLQTLGAKLSEEHTSWFDTQLAAWMLPKAVVVEDTKPKAKNVINIQDAIRDKAYEMIGELESKLDDYVLKREVTSLMDFMKAQQLPAPYVPYIEEWAKNRLADILSVIDSLADPDVKVAYAHFTKRDLVGYAKMLGTFVEDCSKYTQFKKANRKPRPVKEKTPVQQVKTLKFKKSDETLGMESVTATEIVGATQVWVYNTKTRKLAVYKTESSRGIQVKGSTLQNYDPEMSEQKTLRKPEEQLKELMQAGKVQLRKFLDNIKTKGQPVNGRINAECLLLKLVK